MQSVFPEISEETQTLYRENASGESDRTLKVTLQHKKLRDTNWGSQTGKKPGKKCMNMEAQTWALLPLCVRRIELEEKFQSELD